MKSLFGLFALVFIVGSVFADVPAERRLPQPPPNFQYLDQTEPDKPIRDLPRLIMPVEPPNRSVIMPPPIDRPRFELGGPGYAPDGHNVNGPAYVLDEEPIYVPRGIDDPMPGPRFEFPLEEPVRSPSRSPYGIGDDVPGPRHYPMPPPSNNILEQPKVDRPINDEPVRAPRIIMPVIFPDKDQNMPPPVDEPTPPPNDPPYVGDPDSQGSDDPMYLGIEERGLTGGLDMTDPGPWIPNPVFRDRITVNFGPNANRIPVIGKLFDMNGRLVYSDQVRAGSSISFSGARLASLSAGSYILQLDCGDGPQYGMKVQKAE